MHQVTTSHASFSLHLRCPLDFDSPEEECDLLDLLEGDTRRLRRSPLLSATFLSRPGGTGSAPIPRRDSRLSYCTGSTTTLFLRPIGFPLSHPMPLRRASAKSSTGMLSYWSRVASSGRSARSFRSFSSSKSAVLRKGCLPSATPPSRSSSDPLSLKFSPYWVSACLSGAASCTNLASVPSRVMSDWGTRFFILFSGRHVSSSFGITFRLGTAFPAEAATS